MSRLEKVARVSVCEGETVIPNAREETNARLE